MSDVCLESTLSSSRTSIKIKNDSDKFLEEDPDVEVMVEAGRDNKSLGNKA